MSVGNNLLCLIRRSLPCVRVSPGSDIPHGSVFDPWSVHSGWTTGGYTSVSRVPRYPVTLGLFLDFMTLRPIPGRQSTSSSRDSTPLMVIKLHRPPRSSIASVSSSPRGADDSKKDWRFRSTDVGKILMINYFIVGPNDRGRPPSPLTQTQEESSSLWGLGSQTGPDEKWIGFVLPPRTLVSTRRR